MAVFESFKNIKSSLFVSEVDYKIELKLCQQSVLKLKYCTMCTSYAILVKHKHHQTNLQGRTVIG